MSGQLEVHHGALCTAPVSLNLCCRGPYPQPGHSPREALTLRPILLWQLRSSGSNAKRYCYVFMVTLYSCLCQQQGYVCVNPGRAGRKKWHSGSGVRRKMVGGFRGRKWIWNLCLSFCIASPAPYLLGPSYFCHPLQFLAFGFEEAAACGDRVGGLLPLLVLFHLQDLTEEPEDGVEAHPGRQLMPLCAYMEQIHMNEQHSQNLYILYSCR